MGTLKVLQTNFTSGVLDPKLAAREDITFYYNGLKDGLNLTVMPQGGVKGRPGLQFVRKLSKPLSAIDLSAVTITAPEGGTPANVKDGNAASYLTTANNLSTTNPFVIARVDFGSARAISAIDIINIKLSAGALSDELRIQYSSNDSSWSNYGFAFNVDATDRSRRRRDAGGVVTARYWRLVRIGATSLASTVSVAELKFWSETADLSNVRLVPFAYSTQEAYMMAVTAGNIDIFTGDTWQGSIAIDHTSAQLPTMNWTQSLDTLLLFHKDVRPPRIFRQGGDDEFDFRAAPFENIPQYDYGAGTGGVNEVQTLNDGGTLASGDKFTVLLEGKRTATITAGASRAASATAIESALNALVNVGSGITVADASGNGFAVTFAGNVGLQPWDDMTVSVLTGNSVWSTSKTTEGKFPGEDIMSNARGWPRAGLFHQSRLDLGGIASLPDAILFSVVSEYFNFDTERDDATKALLFRAETDQVGAIYNIVAGRHLSLFTNDGEFYFPNETISDESVIKLTTRSGSKEGLRVFEVDGALIFFQGVKDDVSDREIATSVREFLFVDTEQSYQANLVSKLSSHLIINPADAALRKALSTDDADILLQINENGTATAYTLLRGDAVNAFMPLATRPGDKLLAVGVDKKRHVYFATERTIDGETVRYIERFNEDLLLDCGGIVTIEYENVSAADAGQDEFEWTFSNPGSADAIGVRLNGGRLEPEDYDVDLGTKTVTLISEVADMVQEGDIIRISSMIDQIAGLDHLEGEMVKTVIDGTEGEEFEVIGGVLDLGDFADTEVQYGFDYEVSGKMMPLRIPESETLSGDKVRVVKAILQLFETGGIEIRANGKSWQEVSLIQTDDEILDRSTAELLFTGEKKIGGLRGFSIGAPFEFRRPGPTQFTLLGITREVSL